jgi:hypothetical protein
LAIPCFIVAFSFIVYLWNHHNIRAPRHFTVDDTMPWYTSLFELIDADLTGNLDPVEIEHMFKAITHRTISREDTIRVMKKMGAKYNAARGEFSLPRAQYLLAVETEIMQRKFPPSEV